MRPITAEGSLTMACESGSWPYGPTLDARWMSCRAFLCTRVSHTHTYTGRSYTYFTGAHALMQP
eukprot:1159548-Pelagomonas_calceolata.AAC.2